MASGTLAIKLLSADPVLSVDEEKHSFKSMGVSMKLGDQVRHSKLFHANQPIDHTFLFDLLDMDQLEEVTIESYSDARKKDKDKASATWKLKLQDFTKDAEWEKKVLKLKSGYALHIESRWTVKEKAAGESAAAAKAAQPAHPSSLTVRETHRPWFMRVAYYYDTTKNVYSYTTSFRLISPIARFSENTTNKILQKIMGKSLSDLDGAIVAPGLNKLDDTVDATIAAVLVKLLEGHNFVIKKKNDAVQTASNVLGSTISTVGKAKDYTTSSVKSVVSSTYNTAASMTEYTTSSVKSVASSTYSTAANVTDYTATQVANVSSSAYGKVRGATVYVVSHVPYLGSKIRA